MNKMMKSTLLTLAMVCGTAFAQETVTAPEISSEGSGSDWNIKLGVSYRKFDKPKFTAGESSAKSGAYVDGQSEIRPLNDVLSSLSNTRIAFVNVVEATGGSASGKGTYGLQESLGVIIGGSFTLTEEKSLRLSLLADFQYFQNDSGKYVDYSGASTTVKKHPVVFGSMGEDFDLVNGLGMGSGSAKMTMEMDLYVFDLGLSVGYEFENSLSLFLSAGPTISLADIDTTCRPAGERKRSDNDNEIEYGFFVSAGAAFWFNERFGLSAEVRYDKSFGDVGTRYVVQDLDAWGGNLAFLVRF